MSAKQASGWLGREDFGPVTVVRLKAPGAVDDDATRAVFDPLYGLVADAGRTNLVLDLAAVDRLPSLGLGKLAALGRKARAAGGRLALCHLPPSVEEALEHTRLRQLFAIYATEQEAVRSFSQGGTG